MAYWKPQTVLVTGAGPIGLLAALIGVQRGLDVHILDRNKDGPKPLLARELGTTYHTGDLDGFKPDIIIECTGAAQVILDCLTRTDPAGIVCLAGVSATGERIASDVGLINRTLVLDNDVVFGSVNANRRHYELAAQALAKADRKWLGKLITRRVPLDRWQQAFEYRSHDVKVVIDFTA